MIFRRLSLIACLVVSAMSTGCCCVQTMQGPGCCGTGFCGAGPVGSCSSCQGGCGETYVDEWVSHPPVVDNCCGPHNCRPVRSFLAMLWGSPYHGACGCGDSCGCDSCGDGCSCGYESDGYAGCSSCGGEIGAPVSSGGCNCGGGGMSVPTEAPAVGAMHYSGSGHVVRSTTSAPKMMSQPVVHTAPQRTKATVASHRVNPALQKLETVR
ncbi:MAG: hypothetical protein U0892_23360 [Pirellulales bacterium]